MKYTGFGRYLSHVYKLDGLDGGVEEGIEELYDVEKTRYEDVEEVTWDEIRMLTGDTPFDRFLIHKDAWIDYRELEDEKSLTVVAKDEEMLNEVQEDLEAYWPELREDLWGWLRRFCGM